MIDYTLIIPYRHLSIWETNARRMSFWIWSWRLARTARRIVQTTYADNVEVHYSGLEFEYHRLVSELTMFCISTVYFLQKLSDEHMRMFDARILLLENNVSRLLKKLQLNHNSQSIA